MKLKFHTLTIYISLRLKQNEVIVKDIILLLHKYFLRKICKIFPAFRANAYAILDTKPIPIFPEEKARAKAHIFTQDIVGALFDPRRLAFHQTGRVARPVKQHIRVPGSCNYFFVYLRYISRVVTGA